MLVCLFLSKNESDINMFCRYCGAENNNGEYYVNVSDPLRDAKIAAVFESLSKKQ